MKHCNPHAPPFVACFLAMLALVVLPVAFADSAGPPGKMVSVQYSADGVAPPNVTLDTGQSFIDNANLAVYITDHHGALANVESSTSSTATQVNSLVTDIATVYANPGIVANDTAPPGQLAGLENIVSTPAAQTIKEAHGDVIEHHIAAQTFATTTHDPGAVDYDLLC